MTDAARYLGLRFLAGGLEGGVVTLKPGSSLVIGRQPGCDVLLPDEVASRRHARVTLDGVDVIVEDLGSTNGTYLNGKRIAQARVSMGDRVLVGESVFTVIVREPAPPSSATEFRMLPYRAHEGDPFTAIQGRLDEVPLSDVLQLLATAQKTGILAIRSDGRSAEVRLDRGRVVDCSIDARSDLPARKMLFRLFAWGSGQFDFRPAEPHEATPTSMADSMDALLMEAARHLDEMRRWRSTLPGRFVVNEEFPDVALDGDDRALVAVVARCKTLDAVLDATPLLDVTAAERLGSLQARGALSEERATR